MTRPSPRWDTSTWRVRAGNVTDLRVIGIPQKFPHRLEEDRFQRLFPLGVPVVFNQRWKARPAGK